MSRSLLDAETVLAAAPCAMLIYDDQGQVVFINPAAGSLLQTETEQLPRVTDLFGSLPHREAAAGRVVLTLADQRQLEAEVSAFRAPDDQATWHTLWLHPRPDDRCDPLQTLVSLIPRVVHDLRNPLAGIQSLAELMLEEAREGQQLDDLHGILEEVRLLELHLERLRLAESFDPHAGRHFDLAAALSDLADFFSVRAKRIGVAFSLVEPPAHETRLHAKFLPRILGNVLHAALEEEDGGSLTLKLDTETDWLWFHIERRPGNGAPHSHLDHNPVLELIGQTLTAMGGRLETVRSDCCWSIRLGIADGSTIAAVT